MKMMQLTFPFYDELYKNSSDDGVNYEAEQVTPIDIIIEETSLQNEIV